MKKALGLYGCRKSDREAEAIAIALDQYFLVQCARRAFREKGKGAFRPRRRRIMYGGDCIATHYLLAGATFGVWRISPKLIHNFEKRMPKPLLASCLGGIALTRPEHQPLTRKELLDMLRKKISFSCHSGKHLCKKKNYPRDKPSPSHRPFVGKFGDDHPHQ